MVIVSFIGVISTFTFFSCPHLSDQAGLAAEARDV